MISPTVAMPSTPRFKLLPLIIEIDGASIGVFVGSSPLGSDGVPVSFASAGLLESESSFTTTLAGLVPAAIA